MKFLQILQALLADTPALLALIQSIVAAFNIPAGTEPTPDQQAAVLKALGKHLADTRGY